MHLDLGWFAERAHTTHLCTRCGSRFKSDSAVVGNPLAGIEGLFVDVEGVV